MGPGDGGLAAANPTVIRSATATIGAVWLVYFPPGTLNKRNPESLGFGGAGMSTGKIREADHNREANCEPNLRWSSVGFQCIVL
jgi:hypothetical protein